MVTEMPTDDAAQWTDEWPTEPGWYWFYGITHKCREGEPEMMLVWVRILSSGPIYETGNRFIEDGHNGTRGQWMNATLPDPPTETAEA